MHKKRIHLLRAILALMFLIATFLFADEKTYKPKSQIFSVKSEILGGEFRILNVIPLHGDFSVYQGIEITHLKSLVGDGISQKKLDEYDQKILKEFQKLDKIKEVTAVSGYDPPRQPAVQTEQPELNGAPASSRHKALPASGRLEAGGPLCRPEAGAP
ncbi:MAG: hypothetical protein C5B54_04540, partial [Acidobacteria bacterium]